LLRIIVGDLAPDGGEVDYPLLRTNGTGWKHIKKQIAFVSQTQPEWHARPRYNLNYSAAAFGTLGLSNRELVDWHVRRFGLSTYEFFKWGEITGGFKTRFELVRALLERPRLLVLDEPLAHLDVVARQDFLADLETIANSFERPVPIIITSQHLYEVESIANKMIVLEDGRNIFCDQLANLSNNHDARVVEVTIDASDSSVRSLLE
jgi:ABC-2 type transport system ATP-binding protein